jgi:hypothetical protein
MGIWAINGQGKRRGATRLPRLRAPSVGQRTRVPFVRTANSSRRTPYERLAVALQQMTRMVPLRSSGLRVFYSAWPRASFVLPDWGI